MNGNESRLGPCFYMVCIRDGLKPNPLDQNIPRLWGSLALIAVLKFSSGSFQQGTKSSEHCFGKFGSRSVLCSCSCSPHWNLELLETSLGGSGEHEASPNISSLQTAQVRGIVTPGLCQEGGLEVRGAWRAHIQCRVYQPSQEALTCIPNWPTLRLVFL